MTQKKYSNADLMRIAVEEHLKCSEYPRVGAVIAKNGLVLSTGYRGEVAGRHAERVSIEKLCREDLCGATLYTTLEPCVKIHEEQPLESCTDLITSSGINEVYIGVLDPNGTIYSQGFRRLLECNISVRFFNRPIRAAIEQDTFEFGQVHTIYGNGRRRIPVVLSGTEITVQFSQTDPRSIPFKWATLQHAHGSVDLSSHNGAVRVASGARKFSDITDPDVFRFPSHFARMRSGMIAVVQPPYTDFCALIQLVKIFENDILFQWEVRNNPRNPTTAR